MADDELIHELVAMYALDALDAEDERDFEIHLARCPRCREELAALSATVGALTHAGPTVAPPQGLRANILSAARAERSNVVPLRPRWAYPALAVAAVASCVAVGLGVWAGVLQTRPGASVQALPLRGAVGSLVVAKGGSAALVVSGLPAAPAGKTYEIWVMRGTDVRPAGLFKAGGRTATVELTRRVGHGAFVGVTVERAGGVTKPSGPPIVTSAPA